MPRMWEHDSTPEIGEEPQQVINRQLLKDADLLVAMFWTRIGSPTGKAASGTVEEIEEHISGGKPAMLYFSSSPVAPDKLDQTQYEALKTFKSWARSNSLYQEYSSVGQFAKILQRQLAQTMIQKFSGKTDREAPRQTISVLPVGIRDAPVSEAGLAPRSMPPDLSGAARDLLNEATKDPRGNVLVTKTMGGTFIMSNRRHFGDARNPRDAALYTSALRELVSQGLVAQDDRKGEVFRVTNAGYLQSEGAL